MILSIFFEEGKVTAKFKDISGFQIASQKQVGFLFN